MAIRLADKNLSQLTDPQIAQGFQPNPYIIPNSLSMSYFSHLNFKDYNRQYSYLYSLKVPDRNLSFMQSKDLFITALVVCDFSFSMNGTTLLIVIQV